ncbi:glycosyltransferase family 4 protein [Chamaesiphon sp.]|uniref:glycosyltransferase family 4 protein n=1 Tax=Chamaesiphon sp. TaxID=2814140 RepID=UPI0035943178
MADRSSIHLGILYIGKQGGICHYTYELVRVLSKIVKVTCYLSANNELLAKWQELPCQIKTFETYSGFSTLLWSMVTQQPLNVAKEIDRDRPDILLDTGSGPWAGMIKKAISSQVLTIDVIHDVETHPDRWLPLITAYQFFYPNKADALVGISDYSYQQLLLKFPKIPILKSAHGIIQPAASIDLDRIATNRNKFLFFGRIEKYKGVEILVKSFAIAKQVYPDLSLSIVGKGTIDEQLKTQMSELGIQLINRWVAEAELAEIVANHGIAVMPYLSATQSGVAAVCLGNGLPAIATNVGALPEQIIHERNGAIVPPGDADALAQAMLAISQDYASAYKMAQEAGIIAETTYSWKNIGTKLLEDMIDLVRKERVAI